MRFGNTPERTKAIACPSIPFNYLHSGCSPLVGMMLKGAFRIHTIQLASCSLPSFGRMNGAICCHRNVCTGTGTPRSCRPSSMGLVDDEGFAMVCTERVVKGKRESAAEISRNERKAKENIFRFRFFKFPNYRTTQHETERRTNKHVSPVQWPEPYRLKRLPRFHRRMQQAPRIITFIK